VTPWGATGKILSTRPTDPNDHNAGFDVEVELDTLIGKHTLTIHSAATSMADAPDDVRRKLYDVGVDLATAFQNKGSLK
jgi:hypothetical protein